MLGALKVQNHFNISNVSFLDFLFASQNLNANRFSREVILLILIICVTHFYLTLNDVKICIVMSPMSTSDLDRCLGISCHRKQLSQIFCLNNEFLVQRDENVK